MKINLTLLIVIFSFTINSFGQEKEVNLRGTIYSGKELVKDVHVYNLSKRFGAISNDLGAFQIKASVNDTLYISSLQYEKTYVTVTEENIESKVMNIDLISLVTALDEVFLRHLTGDLNFDLANKPEDSIPDVGYTYKTSDLYKQIVKGEYEGTDHPNAQEMTDPIGAPAAGIGLPDKKYQELLRLKREISLKKDFPDKLKREFGLDYFTKDLKIKENKINLFISYCEYLEIFEKYYDNKVLEVIEILKVESVKFNEIEN